MATWIFQGNPDKFDIDGYLAADLASITWLVRQHRGEIAVGDVVFLWKSLGAKKNPSGVIAECRVASEVRPRPDDAAARPFWVDGSSTASEPRVELIVIRVARAKEVLKRDWLKEDPVLRDLSIFKMAQGTNFRVPDHQAQRLRTLWDRTGKDWTWRDSVAGLWAYTETKGGEVSQLPGSPVARVAIAIGRVIGGVYNKVMNFRAIDPTDPRKGMTGGGDTDREVWKAFFDAGSGEVDRVRLDAEVLRLGLNLSGSQECEAVASAPIAPSASGDLSILLKRYRKALSTGVFAPLPEVTTTTTQTFIRNPLVVEIAKLRAGSKCEVPGCTTPTFVGETGQPYCEVHHIRPLSEGGEDTIENTICLCPVHHREAHYGNAKQSLRVTMHKIREF